MKNKNLKIVSILLIFLIILITIFGQVNAKSDNLPNIESVNYSEEYKKWLELPEEEKNNTLMPKMYNVEQESVSDYLETNTVLRASRLLRASSDTKFDLRDYISNNIKIRNQKKSNTCWTFASLGALETTLAYTDYRNSATEIEYDFSERHMDYSSARTAFLNGEINNKGYNRTLSDGGTERMAQSYLSNGSGAIPESEMEFEDNTDNIDISLIQNKTVSTTLYDTQEFEDPGTDETKIEETKLKMKEHINNYGGIFAGIYGAKSSTNFYNSETGALFCNDTTKTRDHAVTIIGWDDEYSTDKFNTSNVPKNPGAWIAKNSYGETVGDKGFVYISYEDVNVYKQLWAIKKAVASKDYKNIYQNDLLGANKNVKLSSDTSSKIYIANAFTRDSSIEEAVDKISVYTFNKYDKVKVYINPNDSNKSKESLTEVELANGTTTSVDVGYHTIEFKNPINLKGSSFVIVLEIEDGGETYVAIENNVGDTQYSNAEINQNESFYTSDTGFEKNTWQDMAQLGKEDCNGNICLKAFTTNTVAEPEQPTEPDNPDQPTEPEQPTEPDNPDQPTEPEQPTEPDNPEQPTEPEQPQISEEPTSDFKGMSVEITDLEGYTFTDTSKEPYCKMNIKIDNIKISDENNKYYYFLSENKNIDDKDINNWIEISKNEIKQNADGTYSAVINIDTRNLSNLNELTEAKEMYLYIKQIDKNNNQIIENALLREPEDAVFYVDDVKVGNLETVVDKITEEITNYASSNISQSSNKDTTTANTILPATGKMSILIAFVIVAIIGVIAFIKSKNIDK